MATTPRKPRRINLDEHDLAELFAGRTVHRQQADTPESQEVILADVGFAKIQDLLDVARAQSPTTWAGYANPVDPAGIERKAKGDSKDRTPADVRQAARLLASGSTEDQRQFLLELLKTANASTVNVCAVALAAAMESAAIREEPQEAARDLACYLKHLGQNAVGQMLAIEKRWKVDGLPPDLVCRVLGDVAGGMAIDDAMEALGE